MKENITTMEKMLNYEIVEQPTFGYDEVKRFLSAFCTELSINALAAVKEYQIYVQQQQITMIYTEDISDGQKYSFVDNEEGILALTLDAVNTDDYKRCLNEHSHRLPVNIDPESEYLIVNDDDVLEYSCVYSIHLDSVTEENAKKIAKQFEKTA